MRDLLSENYKYGDLYYAAKRLRDIGVLRHNGYGRWVMVLRGEQIWNNLFPAARVGRRAGRAARAAAG